MRELENGLDGHSPPPCDIDGGFKFNLPESEMATTTRNIWRAERPAAAPWMERLNHGMPGKYLVVTCDAHVNEPLDFLKGRIEAKFESRLPHVHTDADGTQWLVSEAAKPQLVRVPESRPDLLMTPEEFESFEVLAPYTEKMETEDVMRASAGRDLKKRVEDAKSQGVDFEIIFPQKGLFGFTTSDTGFAGAMCRGWNRWAKDFFEGYPQFLPMAMIAPGNLDEAIAEVQWAAENGFKGLLLPNRPIYHRKDEPRNPLEYNNKQFEPLWSAIAETRLPITMHVATGEDPRAVGGPGGAITNYVCHALTTNMEPLVQMIASGVFERHPTLKLATIESGIGWVPWLVQQMDYAYNAHHMWVRPVIPNEPSFYYKRNCVSTFVDEPAGLLTAISAGLEDNIVWSNDYPHHEGSFPHSQAAIARQLDPLTDEQRKKVLGGNAARIFNLDHPDA
jgi:predicted TIM-barrel fold metal-dependent hydrolase